MPDSSETLPAVSLPDLITRYLNCTSVQQLAAELNVHRVTIYRWMMNGKADSTHDDRVTDALIGRIAEADGELDTAVDSCSIARAREKAKFARMDFERRRPKLYGPKQEISGEMNWNITIKRPGVTQPVVVEQPIIAVDSQVVDKIEEEQR